MPPEIIHQIASYLPDGETFVNYIEALDGTDTLGGMEPFTKLTATVAPTDLWPELHLRARHDALLVQVTAAITRYFSVVHMHDMYDLRAFHQCNTSQSLGIRIERCPSASEVKLPLVEWYSRLARLPVVKLAWEERRSGSASPDQIECLLATLPHLPVLESLDLNSAIVPRVDSIFDFVASSQSLVELSLRHLSLPELVDGAFARPTLTTSGLVCLVHWLERQPVRHLSLGNWNIEARTDTIHSFHRALWSSATMTRLVIRDSVLPHLDMHAFTRSLAMAELDLSGCGLTGADIIALASGLRHSRVHKLVLVRNGIDSGVSTLAAALPAACHLRTLVLSLCGITDEAIASLSQHIAQSAVQVLNLSCNAITSQGARLISEACIAKADLEASDHKHVLMLHGNTRIPNESRQDLLAVASTSQLKLFV